jgi:thiamine biosynthesis lipoprotein
VAGAELGIANAYAVALNAAGDAGLPWFPTLDGYRAILVNGKPAGTRERSVL